VATIIIFTVEGRIPKNGCAKLAQFQMLFAYLT
jgi:hypothetical protein